MGGHFTKENAAELGRKGGLNKAAKDRERQSKPMAERVKDVLEADADLVLKEMADMALGRGDEWKDLPADLRVKAALAFSGYALGKPATAKPVTGSGTPEAPPEDESGIQFGSEEVRP